MATFLRTKERTGELRDRRDGCEGGGTASAVPLGPPQGTRGQDPPFFEARLRRGPSTHTKVNMAMMPTVTSSCREMMA